MKPNKNIQNFPIFIDGKFYENNTDIFPSLNPHNEEIWATFSVAGKSEVDLAIAAARRCLNEGEWPKMLASDRGKLLLKLADPIVTVGV